MSERGAAPETALPGQRAGVCAPQDRPFLLAAAILASAMGFIDGSVVAIALPAMRESLGATLGQAQWISNAYMLALAALILAGGALGDRLGVARVFGGGIALFVLASLVCGLAPTAGSLIAARALQGLGAACMVPGSLALIARAYPAETRGRAIGIWASASAITTAGGPLLGGALLSLGPAEIWRAIFLVNLPLGAVALWLLWSRVAPEARARTAAGTGAGTRAEARAEASLDLPGAALATAGLACVALALTEAEHGAPIGAGDLALGAAGLALLAAFVGVERRSPAPMLPMDLFARPGFAAANAVTFALYFALSAILFFLPMTVIAGWGVSPFTAALAFAPLSLLIGLFSPRVGALADRTGKRPWIAAGTATVGAGYAVMALAAPAQAFWAGLMPGALLVGLGMMLVVAPLSTAVMEAAGDGASGAASGVNNAVSRVAGLIAVAAMGPVAAAAYAEAGGPGSFGAPSDAPGHGAASAAAFAAVAGIAALCAVFAAALAWTGLRRL